MKKGLLLGAGFSYDLGMPLASEITDIFLDKFNRINAMAFAFILSRNTPYTEDRPINRKALNEGMNLLLSHKNNKNSNYEVFLSDLQKLGDAYGKTLSDKDSYHYLFNIFYEMIHKILTLYQIESYKTLYTKNLEWFSKFENLLSENETWVFTLNHDLYVECLAIDLKIPITYGDNGEISFPISNIQMDKKIQFSTSVRDALSKKRNSYLTNKKGINLIKLHGGLSELEYKDGKFLCNQSLLKNNSSELISDFEQTNEMAFYHQGKRIPSGKDMVITNSDGELDIICKSMLTGGKKYSKTTNNRVAEGL